MLVVLGWGQQREAVVTPGTSAGERPSRLTSAEASGAGGSSDPQVACSWL